MHFRAEDAVHDPAFLGVMRSRSHRLGNRTLVLPCDRFLEPVEGIGGAARGEVATVYRNRNTPANVVEHIGRGLALPEADAD